MSATPDDERMEVLDPAGRYEDLGRLAAGGMAEVRRVRDRRMERVLAMKVLRQELAADAINRAEFLHEASTTARLQHPGIIPVHDHGRLKDGRPWFTMKIVAGDTYRRTLEQLASAPADEIGAALRRAIQVLRRACEAVGYAHGQRIVHRDLKPENLMVGDWGEVLVVDWGLAHVDGQGAPSATRWRPPQNADADLAHQATALLRPSELDASGIVGTLAYMSPEQALGEEPEPRFDVYALGVLLYETLAGRRPYHGSTATIWAALCAGPPPPVDRSTDLARRPAELVRICEVAMAREPTDRFDDAAAMAEALGAWLDGTARLAQARAAIHRSDELVTEVQALRDEARALQAKSHRLLEGVQPHDPIARKAPAWRLEAEARKADIAADTLDIERIQAVRSALELDPDHEPAHERLADHYQEQLLQAERRADERAVARSTLLLRAHARPRHLAFLEGLGRFRLATTPAGAKATLYRFEDVDRVRVPQLVEELGPTPILDAPVAAGSYQLLLEHEGHAAVVLPLLVGRQQIWTLTRPGDDVPQPLVLPPAGALADDDCFVPRGWALIGGDAHAIDSLPAGRVWLDDFVIKRDPVTTAEYIAYLNALIDEGREDEAVQRAPRMPRGQRSPESVASTIPRDAEGRFYLRGDESPPEHAEWPVARISYFDAAAYAAWLAARTGQPWRLPDELEWEKAARGVDGRLLPWGDHPEPTRTYVLDSRPDVLWRTSVHDLTEDVSVYGVRGTAGNVAEWCSTPWSRNGVPRDSPIVVPRPSPPRDDELRIVRGTAWTNPITMCRSATRFADRPTQRRGELGFRLVRSFIA